MRGHLDGMKYKHNSNALHRHNVDLHGGNVQRYTARILRRERTLVPLNIIEGLYIEKQVIGTSMNGRNESGRGSLV